jgi:serine 3-dehydrogenase
MHAAAFDMRDEGRDARRASTRCRRLPRHRPAGEQPPASRQGTLPAQRALLTTWQTMIDTNIRALVAVTHALLPRLDRTRGAIINVSSTAANYPSDRRQRVRRQQGLRLAVLAGSARRPARHRRARDPHCEPGVAETEFHAWCARTATTAASDALYKGGIR